MAADEITVAGGSAAFPWRYLVGVHRQAGGTARLAPFEAGIGEYPVKPFVFGLAFDQSGTRDHNCPPHVWRLLATFQHLGRGTQIFDPAVCAAADEDILYRDFLDRRSGCQAHVIQALTRRILLGWIGKTVGGGDAPAYRHHVFRTGPPAYGWFNICSVDHDRFVEIGALIGGERPPPGDRVFPIVALRRIGTAAKILENLFVRRNQACACAAFDAHVANGKPPFDAHLLEHMAAIFDDVSGTSCGSDDADNMQDQVFRSNARTEHSIHPYLHGFRRAKL